MSLLRMFRRTTRLPVPFPEGELDVPPPQAAPTQPGSSWILVLLPVAGTIIGFSLMIALVKNAPLVGFAVSIPMMLFSYATAIIQFTSQKKKYADENTGRTQRYEAYLSTVRASLEADQKAFQSALVQVNPAPEECIRRAEQLDPRFWERLPAHGDFLALRLGVGKAVLPRKLKLPRPDPTAARDPLVDEALALQNLTIVDRCPTLYPLKQAGIGGITGPRKALLAQVRALVMQLATHHSPEDVNIVAVFPEAEYDAWAWMRWLPHVWPAESSTRLMACTRTGAHTLLGGLYEQLQTRKLMLAQKDKAQAEKILLPALVFILADPSLLEKEPIFKMLRDEGPALGAYTIFLEEQTVNLPEGCGTIAELGSGGARLLDPSGKKPIPYEPDLPVPAQAEQFAQAIAPVRLVSSVGLADIPDRVTLLDVLGVNRVEEIDLDRLWDEAASKPQETLSVPVGRKVGSELFFIDLHEPKGAPGINQGHGPHGLVAGMTGSGKGEFLESLVASLAVHYHPGDVSFVILDFGLGATVAPLEGLPHVINTISNQDLEQVPRALKSLNAEFERRQSLFDEVNRRLGTDVQHIDEYIKLYRQKKVTERLPYLVLIVDEFTVLSKQLPEELNNFVKIAVLGRKYGFRMILCTQRPAGVISDQIRSNAKFRICLKTQEPGDSVEVIKRSDAVFISRAGRGFFNLGSGPDEVFEEFQSAYAAASYAPGMVMSSAPNDIFEVQLDGRRTPFRQAAAASTQNQVAQKQIQAVVAYVRQACDQRGIARSKPVWLPPLADYIPLGEVRPEAGFSDRGWEPVKTWLEPVIGLVDEPSRQSQRPLRANLGREGHLAVFGASGAGKTILLETLVASLSLDHSPEAVNVYLLDFGSRALFALKDLPHVGEVVGPGDAESLSSLLRYLLRETERRKKIFLESGVNSLPGYRAQGRTDLPAIVLVLDNYPNFKKNYGEMDDLLVKIAQEEAGKLGIHIVLTANTIGQVSFQLANLINLKIALQLPQNEIYSDLIGKTGGMKPLAVAGRGLIPGPLEFQTALPVEGRQEAERNMALDGFVGRMKTAWAKPKAPPIPRVPRDVSLSSLLPHAASRSSHPVRYPLAVPLGYDMDSKMPLEIGLHPGQHFLLAGPVTCQKTALLQAWLLALAESTTPDWLRLTIADFHDDQPLLDLSVLPHTVSYLTKEDELGDALERIEQELAGRKEKKRAAKLKGAGLFDSTAFLNGFPSEVLAISDFAALKAVLGKKADLSAKLAGLIAGYRDLGFHVMAVVSPNDILFSPHEVVKAMADLPSGFVLGEVSSSYESNLKVSFPRDQVNKILPGDEGFYFERGRWWKVKVADPWKGTLTLCEWVERIKARDHTVKTP